MQLHIHWHPLPMNLVSLLNKRDCYIEGIKCRADKARFGGIAIKVV